MLRTWTESASEDVVKRKDVKLLVSVEVCTVTAVANPWLTHEVQVAVVCQNTTMRSWLRFVVSCTSALRIQSLCDGVCSRTLLLERIRLLELTALFATAEISGRQALNFHLDFVKEG